MPVEYTNRKGNTYYLHEGRTKTGKPKFYFATHRDGKLADTVPEGFEIAEGPNGEVSCRRIVPSLITNEEVEVVRQALRNVGKEAGTQVRAEKASIVVYAAAVPAFADERWPFPGMRSAVQEVLQRSARFEPVLKFELEDEATRTFSTCRWCYLGSIDDWFPIGPSGPLSKLARTYCRHVGEESFFELM